MDITIIGAGVAGLSAAIAAAQKGFRTVVLERTPNLRAGPGETLHPGAEAIFSTLGVHDAVEKNACGRPLGIAHNESETWRRKHFGQTKDQAWRGYHIRRQALLEVFLTRAQELGVEVQFAEPVLNITTQTSKRTRITTRNKTFDSTWVINASAHTKATTHTIATDYDNASPPLFVAYGYETTTNKEEVAWPQFSLLPWGWSWRAALGDGETAIVELYKSKALLTTHKPQSFRTLDQNDAARPFFTYLHAKHYAYNSFAQPAHCKHICISMRQAIICSE
ncbi:MAG: FAD-dependent oxidoreductase, partial [Pseudomonadota bacterium]